MLMSILKMIRATTIHAANDLISLFSMEKQAAKSLPICSIL